MAASVLADSGFLIAFLNRRDGLHAWAAAESERFPPLWKTCSAALSEAFHLLGPRVGEPLREMLRRKALVRSIDLAADLEPVLKLLRRYATLPTGLADACLVRMTEKLAEAMLLTTDTYFRIFRRNGRQAVTCVFPR
jgi:predicted nucleic acid-binding protein